MRVRVLELPIQGVDSPVGYRRPWMLVVDDILGDGLDQLAGQAVYDALNRQAREAGGEGVLLFAARVELVQQWETAPDVGDQPGPDE